MSAECPELEKDIFLIAFIFLQFLPKSIVHWGRGHEFLRFTFPFYKMLRTSFGQDNRSSFIEKAEIVLQCLRKTETESKT